MGIAKCDHCGAQWFDGVHYWSTGKRGNELDLAGLVCNNHGDPSKCINPCLGKEGGDTWAGRKEFIDRHFRGSDTGAGG